MRNLTPQEVLFIHARVTATTGGSRAIRDLGLLSAAVARPQATFDGRDLYEDLFAKAAALMSSLIQNHPFMDGNKRTGITAAGIFLRLNGWRLDATNEEIEHFVLRVAAGGVDWREIAAWLRRSAVAVEGS